MRTLIVNAHPDPRSAASATNRLVRHLLDKLPADSAEVLDLVEADVQPINKPVLDMYAQTAFRKEAPDAGQAQLLARIGAVITQFKSAQRVVIALPMYNFGIPARLKDWIDNIVAPGQTFRYGKDGVLHGLMGGHKALVLQASGSVFSSGEYARMEFTVPYLRAVLCDFLGFASVDVIRAEGTAQGVGIGMEAAVRKACAEMDAKLDSFMAE